MTVKMMDAKELGIILVWEKAGPEGVMLFEGTATTRAIASEFPSQRLTKREVLAKQSRKMLHIKDWN